MTHRVDLMMCGLGSALGGLWLCSEPGLGSGLVAGMLLAAGLIGLSAATPRRRVVL